jgi:hypothetical protein
MESTMDKAWECVLDQYFRFMCNKSMVEEKGVHVFHFLDKKSSTASYNCHYFYSKEGGSMWEDIVESCQENKKRMETHDFYSSLLIYIRIPKPNGELESRLGCAEIASSQSACTDKDQKKSPPKHHGLRKRKI